MNAVTKSVLVAGLVGILSTVVMITPALSHHSFAMYDQTVTKTYTGKLTRFVPGGNHVQLIFDVIDDTGKPVMENGKPMKYGVETSSAAALARQGITVKSFPVGTIFTVTFHPLRDGRPFGAVNGGLIKCGMEMPKGGCNAKTGQSLAGNAN